MNDITHEELAAWALFADPEYQPKVAEPRRVRVDHVGLDIHEEGHFDFLIEAKMLPRVLHGEHGFGMLATEEEKIEFAMKVIAVIFDLPEHLLERIPGGRVIYR